MWTQTVQRGRESSICDYLMRSSLQLFCSLSYFLVHKNGALCKFALDPKYCDLIDQKQVSISHINL